MIYIPVAGTNARKREKEWTALGSLFNLHMYDMGFVRQADEFGFWSTALAGTFFTGSAHLAWQFGGQQLYRFLQTVPFQDRNLIAHSHGGAVVAYALTLKPRLCIRSLITVDSPMPTSMDDVWWDGHFSIGVHIHLYGTGLGSHMRWLGQRGRFRRKMEWADHNLAIKGGHSGILRKAKYIPQINRALILVQVAPTFQDGYPQLVGL